MSYFYAINNQQQGPVSEDELLNLHRSGIVTSQTLVWREGMAEWKPYGELFAASLTEVPMSPGEKDIMLQQMREGVSSQSADEHGQLAGFGIRLGAYVIDNIIMTVATYAITIPLGLAAGVMGEASGNEALLTSSMLLSWVISIIIPLAYTVITLGSKWQATLGMKIVGIRIVREDGSDCSFLLAFGRYFAAIISAMILLIGYFWMLWDDKNQTLHDKMCSTLVVHRN